MANGYDNGRDSGVSGSETANYGMVNGAGYPHAILPASGANEDGTHWNGSATLPAFNNGAVELEIGYYMRPNHVIVNGACTNLYFMFSGSREDAADHEGAGWVEWGSGSSVYPGAVGEPSSSYTRFDIQPLAWSGSECFESSTAGSGSVIFVYDGRIW